MRTFLVSAILYVSCCTVSSAQLGDILKQAGESLGHRDTSGLSDDKITAGLEQALQVSTSKAVSLTGKPDGFLKNAAIKILLPPKLKGVGSGHGRQSGRTRSRHEPRRRAGCAPGETNLS